MKVVGFTIEIKGQKDILATTKILGLLNTQLILINGTLIELYKTSGTVGRQLSKQFKGTSSSVKKLGTVVKSSFQTFEKGNKVVQNMGNGFFEVTKQIDKTAKEFKELDKATEKDSKSIKDLIKRNKELKKVLQEQPINKTTKQLKELSKEYSKNNDAIKAFRKELRTGKKASDATEGSLDQLRKKAIKLKKAYNALGDEQRKTFKGKEIQAQLLKTQKRIQKLDLAVRDGKTSIGLYGNASKKLGQTLLKLSVGRDIIRGLFQGLTNIVEQNKDINANAKSVGESFERLKTIATKFGLAIINFGAKPLKAFIDIAGSVSKALFGIDFEAEKASVGVRNLQNEFNAEIEVLKKGNISQEARSQLISKINKKYKDYLPNLIKESDSIEEITANQEASNKAFEKKILNLATEETALDIQKRRVAAFTQEILLQRALTENTAELAKAIADNNTSFKSGVNLAKVSAEQYLSNTNERIKANKKLQEEIQEEQKVLNEVIVKEGINTKDFVHNQEVKTDAQIKASETASELRKKRLEEEKKEREQALKDFEAAAKARLKIAIDLETQLRNLQIEALGDATDKALAKEQERFEQEKIARRKNFDDIINEAVEEEARLQALFGFASKELIAFTEKTDGQLFRIRQANNQIAENQERQHQQALLQIQKDGDKAKLDAQKKAFNDEVASTELELEQELADEGFHSDRIIKKQIEGHKKETEEAKKAAEEQKEVRKQTIQQVINLVSTVFDSISKISQIAFEAENARFEKAIEVRKGNIENLNEDLQNATGLQKKFLIQQVKQEQEALNKETEAKKKAAKKQAENQKAIQIVQAIIGGALGIVNAFALPAPASFFAAAATAIAVATEIAVIASQKFAKGGILNGPSHSQGGIQTSFGELEGGEAVINKHSTRQFLPLLSEINAAGGGRRFAQGGILTSPISAPNVGSAQTDINGRFDQFLQVSMQQAQATNSRIDRLQVNLDLNNLEDVQDNDANLDTLTTF